ncbi:putative ribonuclease H-like domain-containing protein [Tanacetum coccineum]
MTNAKEMWEAIKSRFGGNDESKKMFQSLQSQLEIHGAGVSTEDANQKFLRSLPASWSQVSLIMRTKPGVDTLSFDDLYNNLRVFESDIKGSTASSSSTQNVAFVSSESTNSTNDVSTAYGVSTSSGHNSQKEGSSSYTDELKYSFFANQSSVAMISMRLKKFYKKTGRRLQFDAKEPVGFDKTKVECFNCHNTRHFARECRSKGNQESRRRDAGNTGYKAKDNGRRPGKQEEPKALVTLDGEGVDWTGHAEDEQENFALMAYNNSGSDTEVTSCSKECVESYAKLKKLYDTQREQLGDASIEIQAYTQALKKVEAQLVAHQKNQLWYEEKIRFMKINLDDKTDVLTYHKKLLAEAVKEKEELKTKLENFQSSSKGLSKLLNSQMSTRDKSGLGYGNQIHEGVLSYEKEVLESVFDINPKVWSMFQSLRSSCQTLDDEYVIEPLKEQEKPSFGFVNTVKHVKTPSETVEEQNTCSLSSKVDKRDWNGSMSKRLDCDFHEKRMAKQVELNKQKGKGIGQWENRPVWNNVQRLNHQNKFVLKSVLTKTGIFPVNAARQNPSSQAAETSNARKVNTARPIDDPQKALKNKGIVYSGCSRHMTINKAYLVEYQDYNGGPIAFRGSKGIKREYSNARTPQQNRVAERKNRTLIEAARTMLADSFLPNTFWAEAVSMLVYVLNRPVRSENQANKTAGPEEANHSECTQDNIDAGNFEMEADPAKTTLYCQYVLLILQQSRAQKQRMKLLRSLVNEFAQCTEDLLLQAGVARATSTNTVNIVSKPISIVSPLSVFSTGGPDLTNNDQDDSQIPALENIYDNPNDGIFTNAYYVDVHPNRGGLMMQMQRLPSLMRLQMMLETKKQQDSTTIRSENVWIHPPGDQEAYIEET